MSLTLKLLSKSKATFFFFQLTIRVSDVNDNAPKFELPDYQAHNVDEDIKPGTSILKVGHEIAIQTILMKQKIFT